MVAFFETGVQIGLTAITELLSSELHVRLVNTLSEHAMLLVPYGGTESLDQAFFWLASPGIFLQNLDD